MKTLIAQGAEAKLILADGADGKYVIKDRVVKNYRIKELDEKIRKYRTRREASILDRAAKIIPVPGVIVYDEDKKIIKMEFIEGKKLADCLDSFNDEERLRICKIIGKQIALLHNNNIIHGDLTTSNMILKDDKVYFIDFGLGFIDSKPEHKAVDLHLMKQAIESKHYKHAESSFNAIIESYLENSDMSKEIKERLRVVQRRGRYKK